MFLSTQLSQFFNFLFPPVLRCHWLFDFVFAVVSIPTKIVPCICICSLAPDFVVCVSTVRFQSVFRRHRYLLHSQNGIDLWGVPIPFVVREEKKNPEDRRSALSVRGFWRSRHDLTSQVPKYLWRSTAIYRTSARS